MLFAVEMIVNSANLNLVAFARFIPNSQGQTLALFSIAIAAAEVAVVLALFSKPYMIAKITLQFEERANSQKQLIGGGTMIESSSLKNYVNNQIGAYFALFLVMAMGMLGTVLATNLIEFYVFFEVMLIPAFFMIAFWGYEAKRRVALLFFFWTHVGAVILLLG